MKKYLLFLGITAMGIASPTLVNAQSVSYTSTQNSGPLSITNSEFPPGVYDYPTQISDRWPATFNETSTDRMFMHTFNIKVGKGCSVSAASLNMKVTALGKSEVPVNDKLGFLNNAQGIFSTSIWNQNEAPGTSKNLSYNLASVPGVGSILNTLNDGTFSIYLQDDTAVNSVTLRTTVTCPDPNPYGGPVDVKGEHFQCYDVKPAEKSKPVEITIQDQFGRDKVVLGQPVMLCNPSAKIHGKKSYRIQNKERHLVCYHIIKQRSPKSLKVQINNQFEGNGLQTGERQIFCAPSLKKHITGARPQSHEAAMKPIKKTLN
ncbi:hypothetical protein [Amphritea sp.]|uniref:DUF7450 family protein n=1 Tax=Amphritea sp. TaxID=1872502 RepID=UPI003A937F99